MLKKVKTVALRAAGTNCDLETQHVFEACGAEASRVHINRFIRGEDSLDNYHILALPGGFSYGDDIAAGRILANELSYKIAEQVRKFVADGKLVIGICNGFQALMKTGLLPGTLNGKQAAAGSARKLPPQSATVFENDSGKYECRWVHLRRADNDNCIFTRGLPEIIELPVAHGEGKVMFDTDATRAAMWKNNQVVFQYVDERGGFGGFPVNPNGSTDHIAGICSPSGRVFGLMPHPERYIRPWHHPRWTRSARPPAPQGILLFRNAVAFAKKHL
jgi:phosphoribosylformylglycinamidine synthase subunit PurQ / glutaminase